MVRELVVGDDVIELGGGLVVPRAPGLARVDGDNRALVACEEKDVGIVGVDPDCVVIVASGRALESREGLAGIGGAVGRGIGHVDQVFILGIDLHFGEVIAPAVETGFVVDALPAFASVVGAVDAAKFRGVQRRVHALRVGRGDGKADAANLILRR
jgi:hypothetical protein